MFWSSETIAGRLDDLILDANGKPAGDPEKIDCAAYTLTVGPEAYVTPSSPALKPKDSPIIKLKDGDDFRIPPGQFVFLITDEFVKIPTNAIGFISLKTTSLKFKGLINVSGFHVDPGYQGRLMFSAYNAGPSDIPLRRGDELANIWFASLDISTKDFYSKHGVKNIQSKTISGITGEVFSPMSMKAKLEELDTKVDNLKNSIMGYVNLAITVAILSVALNLGVGWIKDHIPQSKEPQVITIEPSKLDIKVHK